jgi:Rap1a immunity proteins
MRGEFALVILTISLLLQTSARADGDVQKLVQECGANNPSYDLFYCLGRVGGISDVMGLNGIAMRKQPSFEILQLSICSNRPPSYGARVQAFTNWARAHPERWGDQDFVGVIVAPRETWPCK